MPKPIATFNSLQEAMEQYTKQPENWVFIGFPKDFVKCSSDAYLKMIASGEEISTLNMVKLAKQKLGSQPIVS